MIIKQLLKGESQPQHVPGGGCSDCPSEDQCNRGGLPPIIHQIKRPKKLLSSQGRKWEAVRKFAPRRSPESLKACRGPARLLHPLPRDPSSSSAAADSSLTRANPLGSSNETPNISSRIYLSLPLQLCSCKITKSDDRIWSGNSLTLRLYEPLQGPLW